MSATTAAAVKAPDTFASLSKELSKAGFGLTKSSKDAIESVAQRGLSLTKSLTTVSQDEVDFYTALRGKTDSTTDTAPAIENELTMISLEKPVIALQQNAPQFRANFLTLNEKQRFEFLNSADYRTARETAVDTSKRLQPISERALKLLYAANGSKAAPFKDQSSFITHRNNIITVLNKVVGYQNYIAAIGHSLSPDSLYHSVALDQANNTRVARTKRAISNHPYLAAAVPAVTAFAAACYGIYKAYNFFTAAP